MSCGFLAGRRSRAAAVALSVAAIAAGGCGGDSGSGDGTLPGAGNADPGSPEFADNVVRVPGTSSTDVAAAAILAAYPPEEGKVPNGWILFPRDDWHRAVLSAQFVSDPVDAGLLPAETKYLPTAADDLVSRSRPPGFPTGPELQAVFLGEPGEDVVIAFQDQQQKLTALPEADPAELGAELVAYRGGWAERFSDDILVVSGAKEDRPYALIAGAWSGFTGDTVAFVEGDSVPAATVDLLEQRQQLRLIKPTIWVIGPTSAVSDSVASELAAYGEVKRVEGDDPIETAVELARYRDPATGFGWDLERAPGNFTLVNIDDWANAVGAFQLAGGGPKAPLLLTDSPDELPDAVVEYLREIQGTEPSQGYVLGDRDSISSPQLAELDRLLDAK